jgi:hypothetical protein
MLEKTLLIIAVLVLVGEIAFVALVYSGQLDIGYGEIQFIRYVWVKLGAAIVISATALTSIALACAYRTSSAATTAIVVCALALISIVMFFLTFFR